MSYRIVYWDEVAREQRERDATPDEAVEIDARRAGMPAVGDYEIAVQAHLDAVAQAHGYDNIISACSYVGAPNQFQAESAKFVTWRGDCWTKALDVRAQVRAGTLAQPTVPALIGMLPAFS